MKLFISLIVCIFFFGMPYNAEASPKLDTKNSLLDFMKDKKLDHAEEDRMVWALFAGMPDFDHSPSANEKLLRKLQWAYKNNLRPTKSVVDFLKFSGENSSFKHRKRLAKELGIKNYSKAGNKNIELLKRLKELRLETKIETLPPPLEAPAPKEETKPAVVPPNVSVSSIAATTENNPTLKLGEKEFTGVEVTEIVESVNARLKDNQGKTIQQILTPEENELFLEAIQKKQEVFAFMMENEHISTETYTSVAHLLSQYVQGQKPAIDDKEILGNTIFEIIDTKPTKDAEVKQETTNKTAQSFFYGSLVIILVVVICVLIVLFLKRRSRRLLVIMD